MTIELPGWRWWAGWAVAASAGILGHRHDWWLAAGAVVAVLSLLAWGVCRELAAQRAAMTPAGPEPEPEPPVPAPRQGPRPPWDTATMPVLPAEVGEVAGRHRAKRGLRDVVGDALRAVAQAYLS